MPRTLPNRNGVAPRGRELPARSADYQPPRAEPPDPRQGRIGLHDGDRPCLRQARMRRDFSRWSGFGAVAAVLSCVAYGWTNDLGYLIIGGLMTGITVIAAVCAMPGPDD